METFSTYLVLVVGLIKFGAVLWLVRSSLHWASRPLFPYRDVALAAALMFGMAALHISFRMLCLPIFWPGIFGFFLLLTDLLGTIPMLLLAWFVARAVRQAEEVSDGRA